MAIGARSQSAKTYLEKNFESFATSTCGGRASCGLQQFAPLTSNARRISHRASRCTCLCCSCIGSREELIQHALLALRETIAGGRLEAKSTSLAIVGRDQPFQIIEDESILPYIDAVEKDLPAVRPQPQEKSSGGGGGTVLTARVRESSV